MAEMSITMERDGAMERFCGARTRQTGEPCRKPAGWGTPVTVGACKLHGGMTHAGQAYAAKLVALEVARRDFGSEEDIDPLEAMLYTVRRGRALASYWRQRAVALVDDEEKFERAAKQEANALDDLNRWSHGAVKAGVAERLVRITERTAERLTAAAEDMLAALVASGLELSGEQRALAVRTYTASLYALEQGDVIEGTASDV